MPMMTAIEVLEAKIRETVNGVPGLVVTSDSGKSLTAGSRR
jgi:hypothetical protein